MAEIDPARPRVSVLLPCWNAERTIAGALASILESRAVPLECIVVDDGSTDRTAAIVEAAAEHDERIVLVRLARNEGVSSARNAGLERVRGDWLTMLDADDTFLPGGLDLLVSRAVASDALAVVGQQIWWDGVRSWRTRLYDIPDIRRAGRKSLATHPGLLYYVSPHAKLLHRSTFEGLRFGGRVLGDQAWIIRALLRAGDRIDVLAETVYRWCRPAPDAASTSITATTRSSARRGVEAAGVATQAFEAVADEARARLPGRDADVVLGTYVERLLRSDLGVHLAEALGRGDPTIAELLDAIGGFIAGSPARFLGASDALALDIIEPPLRRWARVDGPGRAAFLRLGEIALDIGSSSIARRPVLARLGIRLGLGSRRGSVRALAGALLVLESRLEGLRRRVRRSMSRTSPA